MSTYFPKAGEIARKWYVVDASGQALGRLASQVARILMGKENPKYTPFIDTGDHVVVINAEKIKITGLKADQKVYHRYTGYPGGLRTRSLQVAKDLDPTFPLMNAVKGMLQHNTLGADMLTRLRIYAGAEHGHQAQRPKVITFDSKGDIKLG